MSLVIFWNKIEVSLNSLDSKNVFVLVLAHLEPELGLFEVDDIGDVGDDDLWHHYLPNFNQLLLGF